MGQAFYLIRIEGYLDPNWSEWFAGLTIRHDPNGETVLVGPISDQAALFGILTKVRDLGLTLIAVNRVEREPT
jgi:hypothetical protein